MSRIDLIKKSIYCRTIVRKQNLVNSATQAYYDDLLRALSIDDFPLIEIDTINKRTYTCETYGDKRYYLVFDQYLLECIYEIDQIMVGVYSSRYLDSFISKIIAEECYSNRRYALSIHFATQYMNTLDSVISEYNAKCTDELIPNALFIQQAFLIAHELFHFVLNKDPTLLATGIEKKRQFLDSQQASIGGVIKKYIDNQYFLEECLCDATGLIQAIEIARSLEKMNIAEAATVAAMAIMGQITVSTIQEAAKKTPTVSYKATEEKLMARLMHFMAFAPQYIEENFSLDESRKFMQNARSMYNAWLQNTQLLVDKKLNAYTNDLQGDRDSLSIDDLEQAKETLKQVFCL